MHDLIGLLSTSSLSPHSIRLSFAAVDLFTPVVPSERFHPNFAAAISPFGEQERSVMAGWANGFPDRDGKFVTEFQTTFNSCFWELYLHALISKLGFAIDWRHASPDFFVTKNGQPVVMEATTANAAQGKSNEWDAKTKLDEVKNLNIPAINREATIRLAGAITAKSKRYTSDYRKLAHVGGKPFVIAVSPFEQPFFNLQHDRPIRSLLYDYYIDEAEFSRNPAQYPNGPPGIALGSVTKDNGVEIELGFFNSNVMEHVSAVLFSCLATWGKADALAPVGTKTSIFNCIRNDATGRPQTRPGLMKDQYVESLEDGVQIYHNPYAKVPLAPELFRHPGIVQHYYDHDTDDWVYEGLAHALVWRNSIGIMPENAG